MYSVAIIVLLLLPYEHILLPFALDHFASVCMELACALDHIIMEAAHKILIIGELQLAPPLLIILHKIP